MWVLGWPPPLASFLLPLYTLFLGPRLRAGSEASGYQGSRWWLSCSQALHCSWLCSPLPRHLGCLPLPPTMGLGRDSLHSWPLMGSQQQTIEGPLQPEAPLEPKAKHNHLSRGHTPGAGPQCGSWMSLAPLDRCTVKICGHKEGTEGTGLSGRSGAENPEA